MLEIPEIYLKIVQNARYVPTLLIAKVILPP